MGTRGHVTCRRRGQGVLAGVPRVFPCPGEGFRWPRRLLPSRRGDPQELGPQEIRVPFPGVAQALGLLTELVHPCDRGPLCAAPMPTPLLTAGPPTAGRGAGDATGGARLGMFKM